MTRLRVLHLSDGRIAVEQGNVNDWAISYNPDDGRYYVEHPCGDFPANFKELRNARQWAKKHKVCPQATSK